MTPDLATFNKDLRPEDVYDVLTLETPYNNVKYLEGESLNLHKKMA